MFEKKFAILENEKRDLEKRICWIENEGLQCESKWRTQYLQMSKRIQEIERLQCE